MLRILFTKELRVEPYEIAYDPNRMDEAAEEAMVGLVECLYPQSALVTIFEGTKMVAIYDRRIRGWQMIVPDGNVLVGFRQVANIIKGASPVEA